MESLLDDHIVDLATIHELRKGWKRVKFINILKYYMGREIILFWGGIAVKIWSLGLVMVCLSLLP